MKRLKFWALPMMSMLLITSCGNSETDDKEVVVEPKVEEVMEEEDYKLPYFNLDESTANINWTAFKLESKAGVDGKFQKFDIRGYEVGAASIADFFANAELAIATNSVSTGDTTRDYKIETFFFGTMAETDTILVSFKEIIGTTSGTAMVDITMNNSTNTAQMNWQLSENFEFLLNGVINIPDWDAQSSLEELNTVCEEKHKGQGDKSVLWPDVEISAFVTLSVEE